MTRFPADFVWGTGASSTQCEGAAPASNWIDWEQAGRAPVSGDGNGFATRYHEDFAALARLGLTHHRLSIEWARIEPAPGRRDRQAIEHYRRILGTARQLGISPWVCLHHFTLPRWFAADGGFQNPANRLGPWRRHVEFIAETYGDLVAGWKPVNEPVAYAAGGWLGYGFPPGRNDLGEFVQALEAIHRANIEAALILRGTGRPVASIHNLATAHAVGEGAETAAAMLDAVLWDSWLAPERDGELRLPGMAPVAVPDYAGVFDLIGFSYYSAIGVRADLSQPPYPADAPRSPLGYGIWAPGLELVLDRLHRELPNRPLLVSEYGIGTDDDTRRATYLRDGLDIAASALARGIDLRGFFHWTAVDNYEWLHGYDVRFGLFDRDRQPRESARILAQAAAIAGSPPS